VDVTGCFHALTNLNNLNLKVLNVWSSWKANLEALKINTKEAELLLTPVWIL
jgi:hypothetical protein